MAVGTNAGDVYLEAHLRLARDAGARLARQVQSPAMRAGDEASKHFGRKFAAGLAIGGAVIGAGLIKATRLAARGLAAATKAASDLNETVTKSKVIFGPAFAAVDKFARGSAKALGLSRQEALANAASFGDMFKQIGFGIQPAAKMSKGMVTLAADLASFHNADITQVLEAQQAGFRGEYDSLQRFIPAINAARVQQVAMAMTGKENAKQLTAQEKAAATYKIMLQDTRDAQGDFLRTSKENANQQRIAKAQWLDLKAALGQAFLPAQLAVTRAFTEKLLPAGKVFVRELAPGLKSAATAIGTSLAGAVPPAAELADTAKHLGDRLEALGPGLGAKVGAGIGKLFDLLQKLGPELRNANVQTGDLAPTLRLSGALFGFVADHADTLAKHIPLLVAGFAAYKATQAAANTAALASIPIRAAEVVATLALARSNRALIASMAERTAATVTLTTAESGLAVSTTAAGAAASKNTGLFGGLAGKLGLFATAAAAGAYQGNQMSGAFDDLRGKTDPLSRALTWLNDRMTVQIGQSKTATATRQAGISVVERHTRALTSERQAVTSLRDALRGERTAALDVRQAKLNVTTAQQRLTEAVRGGRKGSVEYKQAQIDLRRAQIELSSRTGEYRTAQQRAASATGGAMRATQQARPQYQRFGEAARTAGGRAYAMGKSARDGIRLIPSKSVTVRATFGFKTPPGVSMHDIVGATGGRVTPRAIVPMRRARGGAVWGAGTTTSDSIPAWLSDQEHVWDAAAVKGKGGGSYARGHRILAAERREARGYATGGPVLNADIPSGSIMARVASRFESTIGRAITRLAGKWDRYAEKNFGGTGKAGVLSFIRRTDPLPYIWGGAGPRGYDCSGLVGAVHLAHLGRPYGHGQRIYTTSSIHAGTLGLKPGLGGVLQIGVTSGTGHMAGRYGGLGFEAESTRTGIKIGGAASRPESFARRYHLARGGPVDEQFLAMLAATGRFDVGGDRGRTRVNGQVFDHGGWLMPGRVGVNLTSQPERVIGPDEDLIDYDKLGRAVAAAMAGTTVELDGQRVGELVVAPQFRAYRQLRTVRPRR